jgi:TatD DNase family protein
VADDPRARTAPPAPDPLPLPVVDNHAHLDIARDGGPAPDVAALLADAARVGVTRVVQAGYDVESSRFGVAVAQAHRGVVAAVALHPNEAPRLAVVGALDAGYADIAALAGHPRVRAIGETGLDYFRTGPAGRDAQHESFRWHIELAKAVGKPLQIHDRDAHDDVLAVLADAGAPEHTVMHCFSGDIGMARECIDRGYYLSFAGTVTFKNAQGLRDALSITPLHQVLVETDAPYLTPMPHRGAVNAPVLLPLTLRVMAGVLGVDVPTLCRSVSDNAELLYGPW